MPNTSSLGTGCAVCTEMRAFTPGASMKFLPVSSPIVRRISLMPASLKFSTAVPGSARRPSYLLTALGGAEKTGGLGKVSV